jgi:hypothetical protein
MPAVARALGANRMLGTLLIIAALYRAEEEHASHDFALCILFTWFAPWMHAQALAT